MKPMTVTQFFKQFPTDEACLDHVMETRYGMGGECPKCERKTKFSRVSSQRAYACQWCGWHTYPCAGTPFQDSRTSLQLWFYAIYLFTQSRHGVSAKELERQLGVTYKCAWRMGHEIRKHMSVVDGDDPLSGDVEIDEIYIGGKKKDGIRGRGATGKTIVMGMLDRDGDVITQVIPNCKGETVKPIIAANIEVGSIIHTDEMGGYKGLDKMGFKHETTNHNKGEYVRGNSHVNTIEGFWSRLQSSINGTHIHVSGKHLSKYAAEFEYRFNSRNRASEMFPELISSFVPPSKK